MATSGKGRRRPTPRPPYRRGVSLSAGTSWLIRPLRHDDLPLYRPLRLEALRHHPDAFGSSVEEEQTSDMAHMIGDPPNTTMGGFAEGSLVGIAGLLVSPKRKQRHKGHIVGVYVAPEWRRTGLARSLLQALITEARVSGLLVVTLAVTVGNEAARQLYLNAGFTPYGTEPRSLMIGSKLLDEELMVLLLAGPGGAQEDPVRQPPGNPRQSIRTGAASD